MDETLRIRAFVAYARKVCLGCMFGICNCLPLKSKIHYAQKIIQNHEEITVYS